MMLIQQQVDRQWGLAAAMSVVLLLVTILIVALLGRFLAVSDDAGAARAPKPGRSIGAACALFGRFEAKRRAGGGSTARWPVSVAGWSAILFLLGPILLLFPLSLSGSSYLRFPPSTLSLRWYANFFSRSDWTTAAVISFQVGVAVMLVATTVGTSAAVALTRIESRWSRVLYGFLISPMIVPTLILAVALYFQFAVFHIIGSLPGLVLAHSVIALPVVVIVVTGGLKRASLGPERAALELGRASTASVFGDDLRYDSAEHSHRGALRVLGLVRRRRDRAVFGRAQQHAPQEDVGQRAARDRPDRRRGLSALDSPLDCRRARRELIRLRLHGGEDGTGLVSGP